MSGCEHCAGEPVWVGRGWIDMPNNGGIRSCPVCNPNGEHPRPDADELERLAGLSDAMVTFYSMWGAPEMVDRHVATAHRCRAAAENLRPTEPTS